jgi:hypothetical protein
MAAPPLVSRCAALSLAPQLASAKINIIGFSFESIGKAAQVTARSTAAAAIGSEAALRQP